MMIDHLVRHHSFITNIIEGKVEGKKEEENHK